MMRRWSKGAFLLLTLCFLLSTLLPHLPVYGAATADSFNWKDVRVTLQLPERSIEVSGVPADLPLQIWLKQGQKELRMEEASGAVRQFSSIDLDFLQAGATLQFEVEGHAYLFRFADVDVTANQIKQRAIIHGPAQAEVEYTILDEAGNPLYAGEGRLNEEGILSLELVELLEGRTVVEGASIMVNMAGAEQLQYALAQTFTIPFIDRYAFLIIAILAGFMYHLGFAKRLPILKTLIIYLLLLLGCIPLIILRALGLPIISVLTVSVLLLLIYRLVRKRPYFAEQVEGI